MEILVLAFIGGIVGAVLMDVTETYAAKIGIASGVNIALLGRWFLGTWYRRYSIRRSWRRWRQEAIFEFQIELLKAAIAGNAKMTRKIPAILQRMT